MSFLTLTNIQKSFGQVQVVKNFNMNIEKGEFVSFLGPSGCGKTTILRMIAGFETPTGGALTINGKDQTSLKPNQRNIGMVFQAYALFPNMTVHDNVAFGMKVAGKPKAEIDARVKEMLALIHLGHLADRFPYQMSGGQQQRVALARALAVKPQVLLLDEPLSALDAKIRVSLREEIRAIQRQLGITTIFVTHDQEEALDLADRVVVLKDGEIEQIGEPLELYRQPKTAFVFDFLGSANKLPCHVQGGMARFDSFEVPLANISGGDGDYIARFRPFETTLSPDGPGIPVTVSAILAAGSALRLELRGADGTLFETEQPRNPALTYAHGDRLSLRPQKVFIY